MAIRTYKKNNLVSIILFSFVFISVLILGYSFTEVKSPKISDIITNVKKNSDLSAMVKSDKFKLRKLYGINFNKLEDFIFYAPKTNMQANELLIMKVKNQDDIEYLKELVNARIEKQSSSFKNYAPDEYQILENHIFKIRGKYAILVISKNPDKIMTDINKSFK
ncbi:DUF4358 domain-containing protein [Haloimpatiens sp. FM7315]|uniref:DUF4358 domain-containing protein n=1 Tax=Haloimpatiens sp. FM7315 TaxID=3298609 RepID=UPI00370A9B0E